LLLAAPAAARPHRIVSLNMCLDELVLRLADRSDIASVSWLSRDPLNANMATAAEQVPVNYGEAEEALFFRPDLVLVGPFTPPATHALLTRVGAPVLEYDVPETLAGVRKQILDVADRLGQRERGEQIVADMDARLARIAADPARPKLKTVVLRPNGYTVGKGSLVDELLGRAGLDNLAARLGVGAYGQISLERLALLDPDVVIVNAEAVGAPSLATETLNRPLIQRLARRARIVAVPARLWTCAGPGLIDAVEILVDATRGLREKLASP